MNQAMEVLIGMMVIFLAIIIYVGSSSIYASNSVFMPMINLIVVIMTGAGLLFIADGVFS